MSRPSPKIVVEGVGKSFSSARGGQVDALAMVDMTVATGEFVSIIGPSGCGKSTLLNIIAGFEQASAGRVLVDSAPVTGPGPERGVVFQEYALFPWLTVADNIRFGPASMGLPRAEIAARVESCIALVHLIGAENRYPHELSGGMRQRCALARCIANDPDVLLMDEPLAALDALTRSTLQDELQSIWREASRQKPKTVVYVTHAIDEALYLSDRVILMSERPGSVRKEIPVPFSRPRAPEVRTDHEFHRLADQIWFLLRQDARASARSRKENA
jgi:NitT/TauT family transport system ATP-binding protein